MPIGVRQARIELLALADKLDPGLKQARSKLGNFARSVGKGLGAIGKGVGRVGMGAGAGLVGLFASQVDDVMDYEKGITRLAIAQGKSNDEMTDFRDELNQISADTALSRNEILKGVSAYQALTGDTEGATKAARTFARVAQATGASVDEVAAAGASLTQNLKVDPGKLEEIFSILNTQGKAGAVELRDLARELPGVSAKFQKFKGGTGAAGVAEMGAALQITRRNFGSASEAATGLEALMGTLDKKAGKLKKHRIHVFDPKTKQKRGFTEIMEDFRRANLSDDKLAQLLGSKEASDSLSAITRNWEDFRSLVQTTDVASVGRDMQQYLESPAGKAETSMNNMKNAAANAFTADRIEKFAQMIERVAGAVDWVANRISDVEVLLGGGKKVISKDMKAQWARNTDQVVLENLGGEGVLASYSLGDSIRAFEARDVVKRAKANQATDILQTGQARVSESVLSSTLGSGHVDLARAIGSELARQLASITAMLVVDGNAVAKGKANARTRRNHP